MNLMNYIEQLDNEEVVIHVREDFNPEIQYSKMAFLISHELSRSGAPIALCSLAKALKQLGYGVVIYSPYEGVFLNEMLETVDCIICYPCAIYNEAWWLKVSNIFDFYLANTLLTQPFVEILSTKVKHIYWWIHENYYHYPLHKEYTRVPSEKSVHVLAASPLTAKLIKTYMHVDSKVLNVCTNDVGFVEYNEIPHKLNILNPGAIESNKGQAVFAVALIVMNSNLREKCNITFCGNREDAEERVLGYVAYVENTFPNVNVVPAKNREELYKEYDNTDIVVVPSFFETTSLVAVETLMKNKILIVSDKCGICHYLEDGVNAFIFKAGDSAGLAEKLNYVVENYSNLKSVAEAGRKVYEKIYRENIFEENVKNLISSEV